MLNGFETYDCDLNPLVAKIARAKTALLTVSRGVPTAQSFRMRLVFRSSMSRLFLVQPRRSGLDRHWRCVSRYTLPLLLRRTSIPV